MAPYCDHDRFEIIPPLHVVAYHITITTETDAIKLFLNVTKGYKLNEDIISQEIRYLLSVRFKSFTYEYIKSETATFATANRVPQTIKHSYLKPKDPETLEIWGHPTIFQKEQKQLLENLNIARANGRADRINDFPTALTFLTRHVKKDGTILLIGRYLAGPPMTTEQRKFSDIKFKSKNSESNSSSSPPPSNPKKSQVRPSSDSTSNSNKKDKICQYQTGSLKSGVTRSSLPGRKAVTAPLSGSSSKANQSKHTTSKFNQIAAESVDFNKLSENNHNSYTLLSLKDAKAKYPWIGGFVKTSIAEYKLLPYLAYCYNKEGTWTVGEKRLAVKHASIEERTAIKWESWVAYYICFLNTSGKTLRYNFLMSLPVDKAIARISESVCVHFQTVMISKNPDPGIYGSDSLSTDQILDTLRKMQIEKRDAISLVKNMIEYMQFFFPPEHPKQNSKVSQWSLLSKELQDLLIDYTTLRVQIASIPKVSVYYSPNTELYHVQCTVWLPERDTEFHKVKFCTLPEALGELEIKEGQAEAAYLPQYGIVFQMLQGSKPCSQPEQPVSVKKVSRPPSSTKKNRKRK